MALQADMEAAIRVASNELGLTTDNGNYRGPCYSYSLLPDADFLDKWITSEWWTDFGGRLKANDSQDSIQNRVGSPCIISR
jgi:hypothetical protein